MIQTKLLIISGVRGDTRRYRSIHLAEQGRMAGMHVTLAHVWDSGLLRLVKKNSFDTVVFQRVERDRFVDRILWKLKANKALCLYDTDDLVFEPKLIEFIDSPDFSNPTRKKLYRKSMLRQKEMLLACDGAIVSTATLAESVKALGKPVKIHHNAFSLEMMIQAEEAVIRRENDLNQVVIGYASGTPTHYRDFSLVKGALLNILDTHPEVEVRLIGELNTGEDWERFGLRVRRIPKVDWRELPGYLAQLDINLAPLVSGNPFSESKSAIKFSEAALVRCSTVASPCGEFKIVIKDGINGMLADVDEWHEKLIRLIDDAELRTKIGKKAFQDVMRTDHPAVRCVELVEILSALSLEIRGENNNFHGILSDVLAEDVLIRERSVSDAEMHEPSNLRRAWVTLWRRGPWELLGNIWVFIRRLLEPIFPFNYDIN